MLNNFKQKQRWMMCGAAAIYQAKIKYYDFPSITITISPFTDLALK